MKRPEVPVFYAGGVGKANWKKQTISVFLSACVLISTAAPTMAISDGEMRAPVTTLVEAKAGKVLCEKSSHEKRPATSITKVMALLLVMEAIDSDKITLADTVSVSTRAASMGGSDIWLQQGETTSVNDLIETTVIMSVNGAAVALAEYVAGTESGFPHMMDDRAKELRISDTTFKSCNGLDKDGHLTSANDVALTSAELLKYEKITEYTLTWTDHVHDGKTQLINTNKLIKSYKGVTGLKTGTTGKASSYVSASITRGQVNLIAVILGSSAADDRFSSAAKLLDYRFASWSMVTPEKPELQKVPATNGMQSSIELETTDNSVLLVLKGEESEVVNQIVVTDSLEAPVESGQIISKITYKLGDGTLLETDIHAKAAVERMVFFSVFCLFRTGMVCF